MDPEAYKSKVKVLLIDDDQDDFLIMKRTFSRIKNSPFHLDWVDSYEDAKQVIQRNEHDIYLIDYLLGERTGLELLKFARPDKRSQPFILLTGAGDETIEWRSMELSASDYLVKGTFDAELLSRTLHYALQRKRGEVQRMQHLVELNRSKDEFISIASHQLRTPATGVKQYVGMLLEGFAGEMTPDQQTLLTKAYESNERQLKIVSDLLKVAQVDAGKVMLQKADIDIDTFLQGIIHDQKTLLASREQTMTYEPPKRPITLSIDAASIRMVLENIIDNASKYSEAESEVVVTVRELNQNVHISVIDEGVGIDAADKSRLFQKFSRLDNSLSTKVGGTGLGLYWARKIINLHGGKIGYIPNSRKGTTFIIKLPKNGKV